MDFYRHIDLDCKNSVEILVEYNQIYIFFKSIVPLVNLKYFNVFWMLTRNGVVARYYMCSIMPQVALTEYYS